MPPAVLQANRLEFLNPETPPLERRLHTDFGSNIPFYDDELDMPSGVAHSEAVLYLGDCLQRVAGALDLHLLADNPVWYWDIERDRQTSIFGDFGLLKTDNPRKAIAKELSLAFEVVSTSDPRKEYKDTVLRKALNELHRVPEFLLYFPEPDDKRSLVWWTLHSGKCYRKLRPRLNGRFYSRSVPGLSIRILPQNLWQGSRKVEVFLHDKLLETSGQLEHQLDAANERADLEARRAREAERELDEIRRKYEI